VNDPTWTDPRYEDVVRRLGARTGLSFRPQSRNAVEEGVRRAMARCGLSDLGAFGALLECDVSALEHLVVELTVGETYFFREPAQFEFVGRTILPEIRQRRGEEHLIRVWSAGCATGEEPYSLAILFHQAGLADHVRILATDISRQALSKARNALYRDWSFRGEGAGLAKPYTRRAGDIHQLDERIRRRVMFEYLNLALDVYPSVVSGTWKLDLILCRNVLIYFDPATIRSVAVRFHESLAEGGWLVTGSADPSLDEYAPYERVVTDSGVFYRRGTVFGISEVPPRPVARSDQEGTWEEVPDRRRANASDVWDATAVPHNAAPTGTPPTSAGPPDTEIVAAARRALTAGDYEHAVVLTRDRLSDPAVCAVHVQAWANLDVSEAEQECAKAAARHPLSAHLNYLHAVLLMEQDRDEEAAQKARRVLYLDRSLAIAHLTLGSILRRMGDVAGARRAFRNARDLSAACPPDERVPLSEGETAGRLAWAAEAHLLSLAGLQETKR
jgi:chemotaxis protein methyltransferase CheR